jgi:hypothetical protein
MTKIAVGRAKKRKQYQKKYAYLVADTGAAKKKYKSNKQQIS